MAGADRRVTPADGEAGEELQLGEFNDVPTLSLSEARVLVEFAMAFRRDAEEKKKVPQQDRFAVPE